MIKEGIFDDIEGAIRAHWLGILTIGSFLFTVVVIYLLCNLEQVQMDLSGHELASK